LKLKTRNNYPEVITLFERALALDPRSVEAQSLLVIALTARVLDGMKDTAAADIHRAEELARQALAESPRSQYALYAKGQVLRAQGRYTEAIPDYEAVLAVNRNWVNVLHALGQCKFYAGLLDETIPLEEQAIRLSPRDPNIANMYDFIGRVHLLQSHTDEAIVWLKKSCNANPEYPQSHADLACAYALNGESGRAAAELAEAQRLSADGRYASIAR
jgi:tetratricopeptide (TPR) repeat protein